MTLLHAIKGMNRPFTMLMDIFDAVLCLFWAFSNYQTIYCWHHCVKLLKENSKNITEIIFNGSILILV